jgi:hypothetical protein
MCVLHVCVLILFGAIFFLKKINIVSFISLIPSYRLKEFLNLQITTRMFIPLYWTLQLNQNINFPLLCFFVELAL